MLRTPPTSRGTRVFADDFGFVPVIRDTPRDAHNGFVFALSTFARQQNPELRSLSGPSRFFASQPERKSRRAISPEQRGRQNQTGETERELGSFLGSQNRKSFVFNYLVASFGNFALCAMLLKRRRRPFGRRLLILSECNWMCETFVFLSPYRPAAALEVVSSPRASFSTRVPLKKSGFASPQKRTGLVNMKSRKSSSVMSSSSTSS